MTLMRLYIILSSLLCCSCFSAQTKSEILEMVPTQEARREYFSDKVQKESPLGSMLFFYKNYISSQDASDCSFSPTCSEYAAEVIKKEGLVKGLLNFSDRFQRCHGKDSKQYPYLEEDHLLYDPVRNIRFEEL